jgi:hypothetical protein
LTGASLRWGICVGSDALNVYAAENDKSAGFGADFAVDYADFFGFFEDDV